MIIKNFSEEYIKPIAKLCRQNMHRDIMPDFLLREKTIGDPDFEKELTLVGFSDYDNSPIAFIQGVIRTRDTGKMGYIKLLCVDSNHRRKGHAGILYLDIEQKMKQQGVKQIRVYESFPNYLMPGIDPFYSEAICFFERLGYKKIGDTSNLVADLSLQDYYTEAEEKLLLKEKIIIRRAEEKDPNPFNPVTQIRYTLPQLANVQLKVYDILGREVKTLINSEQPAGAYQN